MVGLPAASTSRSVLNSANALSASDWNSGGDVIRLSDATILRSQSGHAVVHLRSAIDYLQPRRRGWRQPARSSFLSRFLLCFLLPAFALTLVLVWHQGLGSIDPVSQILAG